MAARSGEATSGKKKTREARTIDESYDFKGLRLKDFKESAEGTSFIRVGVTSGGNSGIPDFHSNAKVSTVKNTLIRAPFKGKGDDTRKDHINARGNFVFFIDKNSQVKVAGFRENVEAALRRNGIAFDDSDFLSVRNFSDPNAAVYLRYVQLMRTYEDNNKTEDTTSEWTLQQLFIASKHIGKGKWSDDTDAADEAAVARLKRKAPGGKTYRSILAILKDAKHVVDALKVHTLDVNKTTGVVTGYAWARLPKESGRITTSKSVFWKTADGNFVIPFDNEKFQKLVENWRILQKFHPEVFSEENLNAVSGLRDRNRGVGRVSKKGKAKAPPVHMTSGTRGNITNAIGEIQDLPRSGSGERMPAYEPAPVQSGVESQVLPPPSAAGRVRNRLQSGATSSSPSGGL